MESLIEEIGKELPPAETRETYETLAKILGNILKNPGEAKFRALKKDNKVISTNILRSHNAASLLLAMGFEDDGSSYTCPPDADLEQIRTAYEILECLVMSTEDTSATPSASSAAAPVPSPSAPEAPPLPTTAATAKPSVDAFKRRSQSEVDRQSQIDQLQEARAAQRAQYVENPEGPPAPVPVVVPVAPAKASGYTAPAVSAAEPAKKKQGNAFDFENRGKKEQERNAAAMSLEEIRREQKNKFKAFESDPNARNSEAYKQPAAVAPGCKADDSWGGWFGGLFGGGSSNSSSSKPSSQQPQRKSNIKGVADLPKPVQRG